MTRRNTLTDEELARALQALSEAGGNKSEAARRLNLDRRTYSDRLKAAKKRLGLQSWDVASGRVGTLGTQVKDLPRRGDRKVYIITSAQNNTHVHPGWNNLLALAEYEDAQILVGSYSYNKAAYGPKAVKRGTAKPSDFTSKEWYAPEIKPYLCDERVQLAPGLVWCGEMNIIPTAQDPLSGLETYSGRQSAIFPHAKHALRSVASGKSEGTKLVYTTGTVTLRNYIQKLAGLRAEFHHGYGGLIVEVASDGSWYVRQLHIGDDDAVYDLDRRVQAGIVTEGHRVAGIGWGDIHEEFLDPVVKQLAWGEGGMLDTLRPPWQFVHDLINFGPRNHHNLDNPHFLFKRYVQQRDSVKAELVSARDFLTKVAYRDWCETLVVNSNHDDALGRWLREGDYRKDPVNALVFLRLQLAQYQAIERGDRDFHLLEHAIDCGDYARFLREDESFVLLPECNGGIECGMHGHLGPSGARGSPRSLARYGRRVNIAHGHYTEIRDGVYQAGTSTLMDLEYNRGPSSWSNSHIVTYPNGHRTIVTMWANRWRA